MSKIKTAYFCQNCGYESAKWLGKCPSCNQWNTFVEELIQKDVKKSSSSEWQSYNGDVTAKKTQPLHEVKTKATPRIQTSDQELNRVLGGGIVPGSIVLIAGEPCPIESSWPPRSGRGRATFAIPSRLRAIVRAD